MSEAPPGSPRQPTRVGLATKVYRLAYHAYHFAGSRAHRVYLLRRAKARRFYARLVRRGDLCFDVGANHGDRTEIFLGLGARVVAVEPNPACGADLRRKFGGHRHFSLVPSALGATEGSAELFLGEIDAVSSLSREWIEEARHVADLARAEWRRTVTTTVTTLDRLIERFGVPDFCKIDVEGYEAEVLSGLSRALPALSFEYTPWRIEPAFTCIGRLARLGDYRFNFSRGESFDLALREWCDEREIAERLRREPRARDVLFGDVYARC